MEHHGSKQEGDNYTSPSYHRYNGYHRIFHAQSIKVYKVGSGQENGYQQNAPAPVKRSGSFTLGKPKKEKQNNKKQNL